MEPARRVSWRDSSRPISRSAGSLANVAHTMGEDVVSLEHPATKTDAPAAPQKPLAVATLPAGSKQYKAEAGDSVSKMASKLMGGNTKANRDLILKANPSLQANPNKVVMGESYNISVQTQPAAAAAKSEPKEAAAPAAAPS